MERRTFLRRGLFGGALLVVGGASLARWPVGTTGAPRRALLCFSTRQFQILAAIAGRTVQGPGADPVEIAHSVDGTFAAGTPDAARDFGRLLELFESGLTGLFLDGRPRPFTHLAAEEQDAALLAWRDSRFVLRRGGYQALRKLTLAAHYASPLCWEGVGYPGPPELVGG